jgi:GT2 family glycosyltransferase
MSMPAIGGLASVIIPCWNQLEFTRKCVAALMRQTGPDWELIVVNNGSSDGTGDYLGGVQDVSPVPVTVIANGTNRGFPAAVNQGLQCARGEYLVLLNNDVVVTDGWLEQMVALAGAETGAKSGMPDSKSEMGIGLVGPMSNYAAPPQLVEDVPYRQLEEMKVFARRWRDEHRGTWFTVQKLSGFCLLMKRAVYDAIGGLDERFGLGFFDDDDLAERARRAGFELAVAHDLFVHHYGSRTFVGNGVDAEWVLDENARRFAAKWGMGFRRGAGWRCDHSRAVRRWLGG